MRGMMVMSRLDEVICPACLASCEVEEGDDEEGHWRIASCSECGYEMPDDPGEANGALTLREMLIGDDTGPSWNDVDLPRWTRLVRDVILSSWDQVVSDERKGLDADDQPAGPQGP